MSLRPRALAMFAACLASGACTTESTPNDAGGADAVRDAAADTAQADASELGRIDALVDLLGDDSADAGAIDDALHDVAWREGWPLHEGHRWLFATRLDDGPSPVALVGDIGAWDAARWPAQVSPTGVHFWVVVDDAELDVPAAGSKYKWLVGKGDFRAPSEALAYGYDDFGEHGWVAPPTDAPHLERFLAFASAHLEETRAFRAYLPAGFVPGSAAATHARTLLLHDGQNVFDPNAWFGGWRVDEALAAHPDVVALAIDNAPDRMDAYTDVPDEVSGSTVGGRADDYALLVRDEALPFFRARYGIAAAGDDLMIAGSSLGGLVTLLFVRDDVLPFGCAAAMSPTLGWGSFAASAHGGVALAWPTAVGHGSTAVYFDSGGDVTGDCDDTDGDGIDDDADDGDNYCVTRQLRDVLLGLGYTEGVDLTYAWTRGATHDEAAWAARFPAALDACDAMGWTAP